MPVRRDVKGCHTHISSKRANNQTSYCSKVWLERGGLERANDDGKGHSTIPGLLMQRDFSVRSIGDQESRRTSNGFSTVPNGYR